jgi:hypothetical protein
MGAWSAEPFGNDEAADWAWELDDATDWSVVLDALTGVLDEQSSDVDAEAATLAIAAAEVIAHSVGRPTQSDAYTESVEAFVKRAPQSPSGIADVALRALDIAASPDGELAELWADEAGAEWTSAVARVRAALSGPALAQA